MVGQTIANYTTTEKLGQSGMGENLSPRHGTSWLYPAACPRIDSRDKEERIV